MDLEAVVTGLERVERAARQCRNCDLWRQATQTVFGEGAPDARLVLIGEQPGDQEDRAGRPFVGPAGRVLDDALDAAGVDRATVYVTNAVKHFKWTPRGPRRIHAPPSRTEAVACRPWLEEELSLLEPEVVVTLGATAAQSLLGPGFRLTRHRGEVLHAAGVAPQLVATTHPSAILRMRDPVERESAREQLTGDLRLAAGLL